MEGEERKGVTDIGMQLYQNQPILPLEMTTQCNHAWRG